MTYFRIFLLVLAFTCAAPCGFAQKKNKDKDEKEVVRASGRRGKKPAKAKPKLENPSDKTTQAQDGDFELQAQIESERLAAAYGLEGKKSRQKLRKACRKYYKAKALLARQYRKKSDKKAAKDRAQRARILEREYGKELRRILPES